MKCYINGCNKEAKLFYVDDIGFCGKRHANLWFNGLLKTKREK